MSQRIAACFFLAQALITEAGAQAKPQTIKVAPVSPQGKDTGYFIHGKVLDHGSKRPVPGIMVQAAGVKAFTDKAGRFSLRLPVTLDMDERIDIIASEDTARHATFIPKEQTTLRGGNHQQIILFRYPQEILPTQYATAVRYVIPILSIDGGGAIAVKTRPEPEHFFSRSGQRSFWQRITGVFRKGAHSHD